MEGTQQIQPLQRPKLEVGDVLRAHGMDYRAQQMLTPQQSRVLTALMQCRTAALGGHLEVCDHCGLTRPAYNSCRDRHCPKCQSLRQAKWIAERKERLLPLPYFHVVFTLPASLRRLCRRNDRALYGLLFKAATTTLQRLAEDPKWLGARIAMTAVLHTWTRELDYHPHLHCIVSAGGLSLDGSLHLVPFDALHDGSDYLLGRYRFHYLTSGRDLLREPSRGRTAPPLLVADPVFGKAESPGAKITPKTLYQRLEALPPLPGTAREARALTPLLGVLPRLRKDATEAAVRAARAPAVLHIATHGLFLDDAELPMPVAARGLRSVFAERSKLAPLSLDLVVPPAEPLRLPGGAGPLHRSALVLAGAARGAEAQSTTEDGLLTADEARSLDLNGTQLVVLSACETGQGALSAGQGVYGLRRAFLVAGAETLVISLWRVHDEATGELMTLYYQKLLDKKQPRDRLGGMVEAMQELRKRPSRSHPYYWAPFLVIGQDGPLRLAR